MIITRKAEERGHANHGWLNSYHTFSFASYYDPKHMGLSALRVINDDTVAPGGGFGTHPHQDMEIISYVLDGELEHKDSMGNGSIIKVGDVQRMSAGTGITHSEFNPSASNQTHFLQIWILPDEQGLKPSYEQTQFTEEDKRGHLRLIASPDGREGSVTIHQDASLYSSILESGDAIRYTLAQKRLAWLHVAKGELTLNDISLKAGDGVQAGEGDVLELNTDSKAEVLLFDLPGA